MNEEVVKIVHRSKKIEYIHKYYYNFKLLNNDNIHIYSSLGDRLLSNIHFINDTVDSKFRKRISDDLLEKFYCDETEVPSLYHNNLLFTVSNGYFRGNHNIINIYDVKDTVINDENSNNSNTRSIIANDNIDKIGNNDETDKSDKTSPTSKSDKTDNNDETDKSDKTGPTSKTDSTGKSGKVGSTSNSDRTGSTSNNGKTDKTNKDSKAHAICTKQYDYIENNGDANINIHTLNDDKVMILYKKDQ